MGCEESVEGIWGCSTALESEFYSDNRVRSPANEITLQRFLTKGGLVKKTPQVAGGGTHF